MANLKMNKSNKSANVHLEDSIIHSPARMVNPHLHLRYEDKGTLVVHGIYGSLSSVMRFSKDMMEDLVRAWSRARVNGGPKQVHIHGLLKSYNHIRYATNYKARTLLVDFDQYTISASLWRCDDPTYSHFYVKTNPECLKEILQFYHTARREAW